MVAALEATAFFNTDGRVSVDVMNRTEERIPFNLKVTNVVALTEAPAHSISTYCFSIA